MSDTRSTKYQIILFKIMTVNLPNIGGINKLSWFSLVVRSYLIDSILSNFMRFKDSDEYAIFFCFSTYTNLVRFVVG